ncbi:MAG: hypothetical protein AAF824_04270 [Bacteroidota bacterium]
MSEKGILRGWICMCFLLVYSCSPRNVKKNTPISIGITLDEGCDSTSIQRTVGVLSDLNAATLVVDIPFQVEELQSFENASAFKYYETHPLDYLRAILKKDSIDYQLSFSLDNPTQKSTASVSLGDYFTEISGILLRSKSYLPSRIFFYGEFFLDTASISAMNQFVGQIREAIPALATEIYYAVQAETLDDEFEWEVPDGIALVYLPASLEGKGRYYHELNTRIGELAKKHQKPLSILRTNLLGKNKYGEFLFQLSYWPDEVEVKGINLNTLYCETAFLDEESPFALARENRLKQYLKNR